MGVGVLKLYVINFCIISLSLYILNVNYCQYTAIVLCEKLNHYNVFICLFSSVLFLNENYDNKISYVSHCKMFKTEYTLILI